MRALFALVVVLGVAGAPRARACEPALLRPPLLERGEDVRAANRLSAPVDGVWFVNASSVALRKDDVPVDAEVVAVGESSALVHVPDDAVVGDAYTITGIDAVFVVSEGSVANLARPVLGVPRVGHAPFQLNSGCNVGLQTISEHDRARVRFSLDASVADVVVDAWQLEVGDALPRDDEPRAIESAALTADDTLLVDGELELIAAAVGTYDVVARVRDVRTGPTSDAQRAQVTVKPPVDVGCSGPFSFGCSAGGAPSPMLGLLVALAVRRRLRDRRGGRPH